MLKKAFNIAYSFLGFKATMVYEQCLAERNLTLINIFGSYEKIPNELPEAGVLLNISKLKGSLQDSIMPNLPVCDLEKELDNVSKNYSFSS